MKLEQLPLGTIDWSEIAPERVPGETGAVNQRVRQAGGTRLRTVEYSAGYLADHWCDKGHVIYVIKGELVLEHRDGSAFPLGPGACWHVADNGGPAHRVRSANGATVFIVD